MCKKERGWEQRDERKMAAIAHNYFPAFCGNEKKKLENVSGIARGSAGMHERA